MRVSQFGLRVKSHQYTPNTSLLEKFPKYAHVAEMYDNCSANFKIFMKTSKIPANEKDLPIQIQITKKPLVSTNVNNKHYLYCL